MFPLIVISIGIFGLLLVFRKDIFKRLRKEVIVPMPESSKDLLEKNVSYYAQLSHIDKERFEYKVQEFLMHTKITGIETEVSELDRLLVASSAIIPIFNFDNWHYPSIDEVLLYPNTFNQQFEISGKDRNILGMVGDGVMNGKMLLSRMALEQGFKNENDKKNTAIHEFVHLIDKSDGITDGIPSLLMEKQYIIPWLHLMNKEMEKIRKNESDINSYGATNQAEFFAVASEYFFERPHLLEQKHPELYAQLKHFFERKEEKK
jgi:Mlc titration factor MtfA (ptsG expression regulator)